MIRAAISKFSFQAQWWLVVIILIFSTVAFGGVGPQAIYVTRLLILASFLFELILFSIEDDYLKYFHPVIYLPAFLFIAFLILAYLQYFFGLKILNGSIIGSVNPYLTYRSLIQLVIYLMFFMVCLKITSNRQLTERLISLIIVLTFAIAILGLAQRLITNERILWKAISSADKSFFGPFMYENHFGGFLALTFPLALGLMHYRFNKVQREFSGPSKKALRVKGLALIDEGVVFLFFLIILTLVACFFSAARVSLFVLLFCCVAYFIVHAMKKRNFSFYLILLLILTSSFLLVQWLNTDHFAANFGLEHLEKAWNIRFEVARQSLGLLREYPLFGTGLETYGQIFAKAVTHLINEVRWVHHNDYFELLTDTGIVGFSLLIGAIAVLVFLSLRQMGKNLSHWNKYIATQGLISIFCIGAMEFSDFHLKIPSIALLFTFQLALLFQSSLRGPNFVIPAKAGIHDSGSPTKTHAALPQCCSAAFGDDTSCQIASLRPTHKLRGFARNDVSLGIIKAAVLFMGLALCISIIIFSTNDYRASKLAQTEGSDRILNLQKAVQLQPSNSELWSLLSKEYEARGNPQESVTALRKAASLNPSFAGYWYHLGTLEYTTGYEKEGILSLEKAVYWAPALLRYSVFLLGAYLRESERANSIGEKIEFLDKAKILYTKMEQLEVKPRPGHYEAWMGVYYYQKLQQLIPSWTTQENFSH